MKYFFIGLLVISGIAEAKDLTLCLFNGHVDTAIDPILAGFALAIKQKAAPIIASAALVTKIFAATAVHNEAVAMWLAEGKNPQAEMLDFLADNEGIWELFDAAKAPAPLVQLDPDHMDAMESIATFFIAMMVKSVVEAPAEWFFYKPRHGGDLVVLVPAACVPVAMRGDVDQMSTYLGMPLHEFDECDGLQDMEYNNIDVTAAHIASCISPKSGPWNFLLFGHGWMHHDGVTAQLPREEFQQLLKFFEDEIETNAFFYKTCHSGGSNGIKFFVDSKTNQPIILSYPVVCLVSNNMPTLFNFGEYNPVVAEILPAGTPAARITRVLQLFKQRTESMLNLRPFYQALHAFAATQNLADLALAAQSCVPDLSTGDAHKKISHLPRLREAGAGHFVCLHVPGRDVETIAYFESEKGNASKALNLLNKRALILSRYEIKNALTINTEDELQPLPAIVSVMPREAIHVFHEISTNRSMQAFLEDSFCSHPIRSTHFYREIPFTQIFQIGKLTTQDGAKKEVAHNIWVCAEASTSTITIIVPVDKDTILVGTQERDVVGVAWKNVKNKEAVAIQEKIRTHALNAFLRFKNYVHNTPLDALAGYLDMPFPSKNAYLNFLEDLFTKNEVMPSGMIAWVKRNPGKSLLLGTCGVSVTWLGVDYVVKGRKRSVVGKAWDKWVKKSPHAKLPSTVSAAV